MKENIILILYIGFPLVALISDNFVIQNIGLWGFVLLCIGSMFCLYKF